MKDLRIIGLLASIAMLAGCGGSQMPSLGAMQTVGNASAQPADTRTVEINLFNNSKQHVLFYALFSYRHLPAWILEHQQCVAPGDEWHTSIAYRHAYPQLQLKAKPTTVHCLPERVSASVDFKEIVFEHGDRASFRGEAIGAGGYVSFCARQTAPAHREEKCDNQ